MRTHLAHLVVVVSAVLLTTGAAQAAVTFDYTVAKPLVATVNPPVTKVRVLLDVTSDPSGAAISVDNFSGSDGSGASTPTSITVAANAAAASPTQLGITTDLAMAYRVSASQVMIEVRPQTWLADPLGSLPLCTPIASPTPKKFAFSAASLTSTGYRIASYAAAADLSSPTKQWQCDCSAARIKSYGAVFGTPPAGTNKGRLPYDVVLVLDRSGSMASPAMGDATVKFTLLQQAVDEYVESWKMEATAGVDLSQDRLGLVFFSTASEPNPFGGTLLIPRGAAGASPHPWTQIKAAVDGKSPSGSTALGGGLKDGVNALATGSAIGDRVVMLLTDGLQNQNPMVTPPSGATTEKFLDLGAGSVALHRQCTRVYTIGMGSSLEMVAGELLGAIANQCSGTSEIVSGGGISATFGNMLVDMLTGNTLSVVTRTEGTLAVGGATSGNIPVTLDGSAKYLIATIDSPPRGFNGGLNLQLFRASGGDPIEPEQRADGASYVVQRFKVPGPGDYFFRASTQQIVGIASPRAAASAAAATIPYHVSVYGIESDLDFRVAFNAARHGTGDPIQLDFQVSLDGVGAKNIAGGIKVHFQRPGDGVGNQLHNSSVVGSGSGSGADQLSPYEQKLAALADDPNFQRAVAPQADPNALTVTDKGGGNYSAVLPGAGTTIPGKYHFDMVLEFTNPGNGQTIRRIKVLDAAVEVIPAPDQSAITVTGAAPAFDISIVPRDRFGNFKGPGYGGVVNVAVTGGGHVAGAAADGQQQGVYVVHLADVPAGSDPTVSIDIGGVALGNKPISVWQHGERSCFHCFGSSGSATTPSKVGTLGSLLLVGVVAYRRRRRS